MGKNEIYPGEKAVLTMQATEELVRQIAEVSGDYNPVHLDEQYAEQSFFRRRIAHGLFCMGMVSNVIGNQLPGEGSIFVREEVNYRRPVYIGDRVTCEVEVKEVREKGKVMMGFSCTNQEGCVVLYGTALVKVLEG